MKRLWIFSIFLVASTIALAKDKDNGPVQPCTINWAQQEVKAMITKEGQHTIYALGTSSHADLSLAKDEAKKRAINDLVTQLKADVKSQSTLKDTDSESTFENIISLSSQLSDVVGLKVEKESQSQMDSLSYCVVLSLNIKKAYEIPEGKMNALITELKQIHEFVQQQKWIDVLRNSQASLEKIKSSHSMIQTADVYKSILAASKGQKTWNEIFTNLKIDIESGIQKAKNQIVFLLPSGTAELALTDIEGRLSGQGFKVFHLPSEIPQGTPTLIVKVQVKQVGQLRKTQTALGHTLIGHYLIEVHDQNASKILATNRGSQIMAAGPNEDEALMNIDRQLIVAIQSVLQEALPGAIQI